MLTAVTTIARQANITVTAAEPANREPNHQGSSLLRLQRWLSEPLRRQPALFLRAATLAPAEEPTQSPRAAEKTTAVARSLPSPMNELIDIRRCRVAFDGFKHGKTPPLPPYISNKATQ